jgi:hypothetical protein
MISGGCAPEIALDAARVPKIGDRIERGVLIVLVAIGLRAAAQEVDDAVKICIGKQHRVDARIVLQRVGEVIAAVGDEHMVVVEESIQPQADKMVHPVAVEIVMELVDDIVRCGDVFQLAQNAMPAVGDRIGQQQTLLLQLDVVRASRGTQHRHNNADDRKQHDHGNWNDAAAG